MQPWQAWWCLCALLGLPALLLAGLASSELGTEPSAGLNTWLDWQPGLWWQAWRWWSAAWVHGHLAHLALNLGGLLLLAWLAPPILRRSSYRATFAWLLAWPLTHLGLHLAAFLPGEALRHYGGLSGVLHAGLAVLLVELLWASRPTRAGAEVAGSKLRRGLGWLLLAGLLLKVALEAPWQAALRPAAGWIVLLTPATAEPLAVVPLAHALGVFFGLTLAALACWVSPDPD